MAQKKATTNGKEVGKAKKPKGKAASSNGNAPQKNGSGSQQHQSSSLSSLTILGCVVIAVVSFAAGILTPPALSLKSVHDEQQRKLTKARTRKLVEPTTDGDTCNAQVLAEFIHDVPIQGMHFVCMHKNGTLDLYRDAVTETLQHESLEETSWPVLKEVLVNSLAMHEIPNRQTFAIFSKTGEKLASGDDATVDMKRLQDEGFLVVMRGGQWLWPGVRIGFKRTIDLSTVPGLPPGQSVEKRNATLETLSLFPLVVSVEGFLSDEECDIIQQVATPKIRYSDVVLKDMDAGRPASDFRTSQSTFLSAEEHPALKTIDYRTAGLVRIPRNHQETVQVLRYGHTEYYSAHNDYFDPKDYQNDPNTLRLIQNGRRNRLATVFWYLSDVSSGGHTAFPRFNNAPQPRDFKDCSVGLRVKPERGKVIIFYSLKADGDLDPLSLHGACKVTGDDVKWAANKWVWNSPMAYVRDK